MKGQVSWFERMAFLAAHPVGEYFWTSSAENPGNKYGGTWVQIKDVFLLAAGGSYAVGNTGGEVNVALTVNEMPPHRHSSRIQWSKDSASTINTVVCGSTAVSVSTVSGNMSVDNGEQENIGVFGGGQPHNNMPPYLAAYCWQRTA